MLVTFRGYRVNVYCMIKSKMMLMVIPSTPMSYNRSEFRPNKNALFKPLHCNISMHILHTSP